MDIKLVTVNSLKKGSYVLLDGAPCVVTDIQISKPGKHGSAKARITGVGLLDGKKRVIIAPAQDNIEVPIIAKRDAQVLAISGNTANVMDLQSYETFDIEIPEEFKDKIDVNKVVLYWDIMGVKVIKQVKDN